MWARGGRIRYTDQAAFHQLRLLLGSNLLQRFAVDGNSEVPDQGPKERGVAQMTEQVQQANTTATRVISLRLPSPLDTALIRSSADAGGSASAGLDWLLRNSFGNYHLLRQLDDCPGIWDAKRDARIHPRTFEQLKVATEQLGVPISVYVRTLLYHFYVTKRLKYVRADGHYTLAGHHD